MKDFQQQFLQLCLDQGILRFGEFTLKSGRVSPYFFNAGLFHHGSDLAALGRFYAAAIVASGIKFDLLFGPAYKGIPLVAVTAAALYNDHALDVPYAFDRKEAKDHGEGGRIVGAKIEGRILIIDDVITAGTAIRQSMQLLSSLGGEVCGVTIALDRQERGQGATSAIQELQQEGLQVAPIIRLQDILSWLETQGNAQALEKVRAYRQQYGVD